MKTTLEMPDATLHKAKTRAAERGVPLRQFVTEAVEDKLAGGLPTDLWRNRGWRPSANCVICAKKPSVSTR